MHSYRGPFRLQRFIPSVGEKQFSSQEFNFDDDIHTVQPRLPAAEDYDREFWWIFAAVIFIVFFLVLLFVLTMQLVSKAVSRHNQVSRLHSTSQKDFKIIVDSEGVSDFVQQTA